MNKSWQKNIINRAQYFNKFCGKGGVPKKSPIFHHQPFRHNRYVICDKDFTKKSFLKCS